MEGQRNDPNAVPEDEKKIVKRTIKDSVFTDLFQDKKYLIQLYQALHPEDTSVTKDDLTDVTIENVLTDNIYNDLGFTVGNRLMILIEAQASWTMNIIVRAFLYLAQTYHDHFAKTKQNLYTSQKVWMPKPELYVIYTGDRKSKPTEASLSEEFFSGEETCVEVKVKMVYDGQEGDIINQYVVFSRVCNEQIEKYGRTRKSILEAIRVCKDRNVLKEYLESKEKEVVDIMMVLYDEQEIMRSYVESERHDASVKTAIRTAQKMLQKGKFSIEDIAECTDLSIEEVKNLKGN